MSSRSSKTLVAVAVAETRGTRPKCPANDPHVPSFKTLVVYMIEQRVTAVVYAVCLPIQHCEHEQVNAWSERGVLGIMADVADRWCV